MKSVSANFALILVLILSSCVPDELEPTPVAGEDKAVQLEFFTRSDFSGATYADHYVEIKFNIAKVTHASNEQEVLLDYSSGWIAFKDIPTEIDKLTLNKVVTDVKLGSQSVNISKITRVRVGNSLQLSAYNEFLQDGEKQKLIQVIL